MTILDYIIIAASLVLLMGIGFHFAKRAGSSTDEFILGGRTLPWWLAGTSFSAEHTNSDTPLHSSRKARETGLAGCWYYWTLITEFMVGAMVFVKFARRSGIKTYVELLEFRYGKLPAKIARIWSVFNAFLLLGNLGLAVGLIGMIKLSQVLLDLPDTVDIMGMTLSSGLLVAILCTLVAMAYSAAAGLMGVVATDFIEFFVALGASYLLTFIVISKCGGPTEMTAKLSDITLEGGQSVLSIAPGLTLPLIFFIFVLPFIKASNGTTDLRFLAAKDEKQAVTAGIWRVFVMFVLRGWPWWVAGLGSLILYPHFVGGDLEMIYPTLIRDLLPTGLRGLMVVGFICAFLSSMDTKMHNVSSIFLNDFYRPYVNPNATEKHYVWVMRMVICIKALLAIIVAVTLTDILSLLFFIGKAGAVMGIIGALRWFWWRLNGWADLTMIIFTIPITAIFHFHVGFFEGWLGMAQSPVESIVQALPFTENASRLDVMFITQMMLGVLVSLVVMLIVTFSTPPTDEAKLIEFYSKVRPYGFWGPIRKKTGLAPLDKFSVDLFMAAIGTIGMFGLMFGVGALFFGKWLWGVGLLILGTVFVRILIKKLNLVFHDMEVERAN